MCIDGNHALLSIRYITAQLEALYKNAEECAKYARELDSKSLEYESTRFTRALYEFAYLSDRTHAGVQERNPFSVKFAMPKLNFLCDHTALLHLKIESGHFTHRGPLKLGSCGERAKTVNLSPLEVVYLVPIRRASAIVRAEDIGNDSARRLAHMVVLCLDQAKFVTCHAGSNTFHHDERNEPFRHYMAEYLRFLKTSGNYVLFDLPDFGICRYPPRIDYSLVRDRSSTDELRKHMVENSTLLDELSPARISQYYNMHWQNACSKRNGAAWGKLEVCLASICSDWIKDFSGVHFFINFRAPVVEPLCNQEVIFKINVKEIGFFDKAGIDDGATPKIDLSDKDWSFAFIVKCVKTADRGVVTLDLGSARFSWLDSSFTSKGTLADDEKHYLHLLVKFFSHEYIDIIARFNLNVIHGLPLVPASLGPVAIPAPSDLVEGMQTTMWHEWVQNTAIYPGCHEVVALSEATINRLLRDRLEAVHEWRVDGLFAINVDELKVRLLSSGKAIIFVQASGVVKIRTRERAAKWWTRSCWQHPKKSDHLEDVTFDAITLAFEVDISKVPHHALIGHVDEVVQNYYQRWTREHWEYLCMVARHSDVVDREVWKEAVHPVHFVLNLKSASYVEELSNVAELGVDDGGLEKFNTVRQHISEYLAVLTHWGHNILHTVPINVIPRLKDPADPFVLTDVDYRVLTKNETTVESCMEHDTPKAESPLLIIYGVTGGAALPSFTGPWTSSWLPVGSATVGRLALSREVFLQRFLLHELEAVNAMTTIVPKSVDVIDGVWAVDLTTWAQHPARSRSKNGCQFKKVIVGSPDYLQYEWEYRDDWKREHQAYKGGDLATGEHWLSCYTTNTLIVPTIFDPKGVEFDLRGKAVIKIGGVHKGQEWRRSTVGTWGAKIRLDTSDGLKIVLHRLPVQVKPEEEHCTGPWTYDPRTSLLRRIDLKSDILDDLIIRKLRAVLEASWQYCAMGIQAVKLGAPVITRSGDFVCELYLEKGTMHPPMLDHTEFAKHRSRWYSDWVENDKLAGRGFGQILEESSRDIARDSHEVGKHVPNGDPGRHSATDSHADNKPFPSFPSTSAKPVENTHTK